MEKSQGGEDAKVKAAAKAIKIGDIREIKCFASPPKPVTHLLTAVLFLLGKSAREAKEWHESQKMLANPNFLQLITSLEAQSVDAEAANQAKEWIKDYTEASIKKISAGCSGLLRWVCAVIEAVESRGGDSPSTETM
ncbi:dynein heavy chain [Plakobranchus ocellatus]|uniref:Dynein heavy chain n=1 Tax=Plakobranchus ocellatus TaxID=259542 RepID=A0AAV3Y8P7_9GAST|nr:dynein heavy chain [Plakobranchus ocellatus]